MDEPGLNLHAAAQADLLKFIEDLSDDYQILYTTHSPFMVEAEYLNRVRTVVETDEGTLVSNSIQEQDSNTLFPLQAALGYDIAQNLFISPRNLLIEGVSDLIYLQTMSGILESKGMTALSPKITLVPVGGLEKVATFISLLRGSKLKIACLLDSNVGRKNKSKLNELVKHKLIKENKIRFFDEFIEGKECADIEDLFEKDEYLDLYNLAFGKKISVTDLNSKIQQIIIQINKLTKVKRFNHYSPANELVKRGFTGEEFSEQTLQRFSKVFETINEILK